MTPNKGHVDLSSLGILNTFHSMSFNTKNGQLLSVWICTRGPQPVSVSIVLPHGLCAARCGQCATTGIEAALALLLRLGLSGHRRARCRARCRARGRHGRRWRHARELTGERLWPPNIRPWLHGVHGVHRVHRVLGTPSLQRTECSRKHAVPLSPWSEVIKLYNTVV